ncbi:MAG: acetoacetate decarboxylase family protein [Solirubrobacterales bacterium]|nr:acetoacetate decarboxylase family protein [Solirubrobacterales bacterium]
MADSGDHPPAPWRLRGEAAIVIIGVREHAARGFPRPAGVELLHAGGWTLGGALLARYDEHATLPYQELIVFSGVARAAGRLALVVTHIYVDSLPSLRGGREIWGLPKELADFSWASRKVTVEQDGRPLLHASFRRRPGRLRLPMPLYAPVFGDRGGVTVHAAGWGHLRGTPAVADFDVPPYQPLRRARAERPSPRRGRRGAGPPLPGSPGDHALVAQPVCAPRSERSAGPSRSDAVLA